MPSLGKVAGSRCREIWAVQTAYVRPCFDLHLVEWLDRESGRGQSRVWHSVVALRTTKFFGGARTKGSALTGAARRDSETAIANRVSGSLVDETRDGSRLFFVYVEALRVYAARFIILIASAIQKGFTFVAFTSFAWLRADGVLAKGGRLGGRTCRGAGRYLAGRDGSGTS